MLKTYLLSTDGCPACEALKRKLAKKIKSREVKVINLSLKRNFSLGKKLGIEFVPEIITVSENDGTFSVQRENGKVYLLDKTLGEKAFAWRKPKGG